MTLSFNDYQDNAVSTMGRSLPWDTNVLILGLGVAGEGGEVADYLKKVFGHGHAFDRDRLVKELGDVLWYVATLAHEFDIRLEDVAKANNEKLALRYGGKPLTTEASLARVDEVLTSERAPADGKEDY